MSVLSPHLALRLAVALLLGATLFPTSVRAQADLSRYQDKNRLLLVFAPSTSNPQWQRQDSLLAKSDASFGNRELLRFDIFERETSRGPVGPLTSREAGRLRARYGVKASRFRALLIGKDGHVAFGSPSPVTVTDLTRRIDRMPMRREEMRRRGESVAAP